jgi:hypothetical protein
MDVTMTTQTADDAPNLWVITKDGVLVRKIKARIGLRTYAGVITRVSPASIWTKTDDNAEERLHRRYDGRLPSVYQSYAPKA